jgi:hypothetical protein
MSRVGFAGACMAATLLTLWSQAPMAQGLLSESSQPFDGILSHDPLGPSQKFGEWSPGSETKSMTLESMTLERAPASQQADAARTGQSQASRRSHVDARSADARNPAFKPRQTAVRSFARQNDLQRGGVGPGSVLALAPIKPARAGPLCFPSATIHLQPNERDACNGGAVAVKGRFEELLNE